jgi:signal transduction histidine kinase
LLDIVMPGIDGLETCRRLKRNPDTQAIPVIFMTALGDVTDKVHGLEAGGVDYITKAYEAAEALARINTHLALTRLQRDLAQMNMALRAANERLEDRVQARTAELVEANAALAEAHRQLQELDRLKSNFLSVITHELRTPFASMTLSLGLLERYGLEQLGAEQREQIQRLKTGLGSARGMVENLIKVAAFLRQQGELRRVPVEFGALIETALGALQFKAERRHCRLATSVPPGLPFVLGDPERLSDAMFHLVDNAIKFGAAGSEINVRCWASPRRMNFEVADQGEGVPASRLPGLWDAFAQMADPLQPGAEGLGLGLAVVKYVVTAHGGEVWARSQVGAGSTFGFSIPIEPTKR